MREKSEPRAKVALFRAADDAAGTARRLAKLGFQAVSLPVLEPKALAATAQGQHYDAVLATSAQAFLTPAPVPSRPPLFVAGGRTALAAEAAGWRLAAPPAPDADRLAASLMAHVPAGRSLLYLAGRDRKPALETSLAGHYALETLEVYAAEARAAWRPDEICALLGATAALHYSHRSAALAAELARKSGLESHFRALPHFCLSRDAAKPIVRLGASAIAADAPNEASLLAALGAAFPLTCFD